MNSLLDTLEACVSSHLLLSWNGSLLALAAGLVLVLFRRQLSPAWRHGVCRRHHGG